MLLCCILFCCGFGRILLFFCVLLSFFLSSAWSVRSFSLAPLYSLDLSVGHIVDSVCHALTVLHYFRESVAVLSVHSYVYYIDHVRVSPTLYVYDVLVYIPIVVCLTRLLGRSGLTGDTRLSPGGLSPGPRPLCGRWSTLQGCGSSGARSATGLSLPAFEG